MLSGANTVLAISNTSHTFLQLQPSNFIFPTPDIQPPLILIAVVCIRMDGGRLVSSRERHSVLLRETNCCDCSLEQRY